MYEKPRYWKPTATLARWLTGVLVAEAVLSVVCMFTDEALRFERMYRVFDTTDVTNTQFNTRLTDAMNGVPGAGWVQAASWATSIALVLWIVWSYRSAVNALALGRTGGRQSPGWVVAGWLIPFVNLVLPYQTVSDLWRSSAAEAERGDGWRAARAEPRVIGWWIAYLAGLVGYVFLAVEVVTGALAADDARIWIAAARAVQAVAALLGAWIVWDVTRRQALQHEVDPAPVRGASGPAGAAGGVGPRPAQPIVRGPNGLPVPGWYGDPSGAYEFRYWDGVGWTEHVSRGGVATIAPVAATVPAVPASAPIAPEWFPDPSGRHQWRFWGGDHWTPHVSDDGVHSDDALTEPAPPPAPDAAS